MLMSENEQIGGQSLCDCKVSGRILLMKLKEYHEKTKTKKL